MEIHLAHDGFDAHLHLLAGQAQHGWASGSAQ